MCVWGQKSVVSQSRLVALWCLSSSWVFNNMRTCLQPSWRSFCSLKMPCVCQAWDFASAVPSPWTPLPGMVSWLALLCLGSAQTFLLKVLSLSTSSKVAPRPSVTLSLSCFIFFSALITHWKYFLYVIVCICQSPSAQQQLLEGRGSIVFLLQRPYAQNGPGTERMTLQMAVQWASGKMHAVWLNDVKMHEIKMGRKGNKKLQGSFLLFVVSFFWLWKECVLT